MTLYTAYNDPIFSIKTNKTIALNYLVLNKSHLFSKSLSYL